MAAVDAAISSTPAVFRRLIGPDPHPSVSHWVGRYARSSQERLFSVEAGGAPAPTEILSHVVLRKIGPASEARSFLELPSALKARKWHASLTLEAVWRGRGEVEW
jgi:hypothetical protein